jgi:cytochrome c peroxidase
VIPAVALLAAAGWTWSLPRGFPAPRVPRDNPMSAEKVELGRRLFFDPRLSGNGTQSCASCHRPELAFTDGRAHALGSTGQVHPRSAMSLANAAYSASLTWADADKRTLEAQAVVPMENEHPVEMGVKGHESEILARLRADPWYAEHFPIAFPEKGRREPVIRLANARKAIAAFERTILSGDSAYDRLVWKDDASGMSAAARRGMTLFFSDRLKCSRCHEGFTLSGPAVWDGSRGRRPMRPLRLFASNGLASPRDAGLAKATGRAADRGLFRVPTLRNVAVTGPYMHDGRFATLSEAIDHYARGGEPGGRGHRFVRGFTISEEEKRDLVAFLESLTDASFLDDPRFRDPWKEQAASP